MSNLMRGLGVGAKKQPVVGGFKVQTSIYGQPLPIVYGQARVAGNLIHMPDQPKPVGKTGGKTGFASKGAASGQDYTAPVAIALCEGPIAGIGYVWRDKDTYLTYTGNYDVQGWSLFLGTSSQSPWSYLTTKHPSEAVPYQFTAYVVNPAAPLPNDSLSQYSWEILGFLPFGGPNSIVDANPAAIVGDFLTSGQYGANFPSSSLGSLTLWSDYCAAAGLFASQVFDAATPARDTLDELFEIGNGGAIWSDNVLKVIPYGDIPLSGNGKTYTPNTTPLYDLGDNDFLRNGSVPSAAGDTGPEESNLDLDPVTCSRTDPRTAFNRVIVEYEDRDFAYNVIPLPAEDQLAINTYGPLTLPTLVLHGVKTKDVARSVGQMRLQRELYVRNTYTFRLGWKYSLLEPMDLVTLTDPGLGLSLTPVRIISVTELESEKGYDIVAEEWPFGSASTTLYDSGSATGHQPQTNVDPGNTTAPVVVEAPTDLASSALELWLGVQGGANWGGCDVYISTDNVNFTKVGTVQGKAIYGSLTAALPTGAAWPTVDAVNTLSVDIGTNSRTLVAQSATDFANLIPLCYVGGEWCAYENASLVSAGNYDLTTLYRGLYGSTIPASHAIGSFFMFIDETVARIPWPQGKNGQTVYFKLPAFNVYGAAMQDVASVSSFSYVIGSDPVPLQNGLGQATGAVDSNGNYQFTVNLPPRAKSCRYLISTSAFPSVSATVSGGSIFNGSLLTVTGGPLTFGQTAYMTVVPFNQENVIGVQLPPINARAAYLSYSGSKTITFPASQWTEVTVGTPQGIVWDSDINATNPALGGLSSMQIAMQVPIPVGVSLLQISLDLAFNTATNPLFLFDCDFSYKDAGGTTVSMGSALPTPGAGWQTVSFSLGSSVVPSARSYQTKIGWATNTFPADADQAIAGNVSLTYSMPTPFHTY